jgi:hypothetical protein
MTTLKEEFDISEAEEEAWKYVAANTRQVGGDHYKKLGIEPWEVMEGLLTREEFIGFLKGSAIKYAMRQGLKGSDDAEKARHYIQKLKEVQG